MINRLFAILTKHLKSIAPCKDVERMTVKENELNGNDLRSENDKKTEDKKREITLWFLTGANILALLVIFFLVTILIAKQTSSNIV